MKAKSGIVYSLRIFAFVIEEFELWNLFILDSNDRRKIIVFEFKIK